MTEDDLGMFRRFMTDPEPAGPAWPGFRDAQAPARRFAADGYLGADDGRLVVAVDGVAAGYVSWVARGSSLSRHWEIGIGLLPDLRGRGVGWRAQAMLCDYLFAQTPVQRIEALTHPENVGEQKSLEKAGFTREGVLRSLEFRAGRWRDAWLYSRLRDDPAPRP
ncbi:GNAT family N-acetyltransferase [Spongiactinospora rosea]|uniref:GNAT family N-acetyltransferase n=1 Tax=Spongiactinospora rosea TaxID=2248750 RepID=A0A366LQZ3_9ACTN|nr:GNAT family N-acetyltransferase [Spongiactinospora rosea]